MKHIKRGERSIRIEEGPWALGMGALFAVLGVGAAVGAVFAWQEEATRIGGLLAAILGVLFLLVGVALLRRGRWVLVIDAADQTIESGEGPRSFDTLAAVVIVRVKAATTTSGRILHWVELRFKDGTSMRVDTDTIDSSGDHTEMIADEIGKLVGIEPTRHEDSAKRTGSAQS